MAPAGSKSKAYSSGVATQADDAKYRQKYGELRKKLTQVEEDNTKLSVKILRSKKAIQRLRIERAILYDRLQSTVAPTNPYALSSAAHLSTVAQSSSSSSSANATQSGAPPSILQTPSYPLADPEAPTLFLRQLDAQKLAAVQHGAGADVEFGAKPFEGVAGEGKQAMEHRSLMAAGGDVEDDAKPAAADDGVPANGATDEADHAAVAAPAPAPAAPAAVPQAIEVSHAQAQEMTVDQA
ncbi:hypothetical protein BMF94_4509 [Rhodotorula taiwanensis]|uniref:INO80 complex subunit F domain-containing protein n=1 Tax=Rhodotorula taiwanensis TaxID=741276 RepID=A0A2S5B7C7_9BASI|nr:hypothetical protein BMF94_4509 [Rhodotorula taiwanensis]